MIQYIENTNLAYCDGYKFRKDKKTGYWLCTTLRKRLHVYIWEKYNGEIPKGYSIHHIDLNKDNNEIENLQLLSKSEHSKLHYNLLTDEEKERRKQIIKEKSLPKMLEFNKKNPRTTEWYKKHYEEVKDKMYIKREFICKMCGKRFSSPQINSKYCSNACKSKYRRKNKLDDVKRECIICNSIFNTSRYSKRQTCSKKCEIELRRNNKLNN